MPGTDRVATAAPPALRWILVTVALIAVVAHLRSLTCGFVYDDTFAIVKNPVVNGGFDPAAFFGTDFWGGAPGHAAVGTWRPLVVLSFWIDRHLSGGAPWLFHLENVLWHALASVLLTIAVARRLRAAPLVAALAGALFAAFAVNTEAVTGVVGRADVMAATFALLAWMWLGDRRLIAGGLAFLAALLCKESAIVFPIWFVAVWCIAPSARRDLWRALAVLLVAVAVWLALHYLCFGPFGIALRSKNNNPLLGEPLGVRIFTACRLFTLTLRLILAPLGLSPDYAFAEILPERALLGADVLTGAAALAVVMAAILLARRRLPAAAAGLAIFVVSFAFLSNVAFILPAIYAERLLYLPSAGLAIAIAAALDPLRLRARVVYAVLAIGLVAGNLARSVVRDADWHDAYTLFASAVEVTPRSARAWQNYGVALEQRGRYEGALVALHHASEIAPAWPDVHTHAGIVLDNLGDPDAAILELELAVRLDPNYEEGIYDLTVFLARHGRARDAAVILQPLVAAHPDWARDKALFDDIRSHEPL